jgi:hypothetical protein
MQQENILSSSSSLVVQNELQETMIPKETKKNIKKKERIQEIHREINKICKNLTKYVKRLQDANHTINVCNEYEDSIYHINGSFSELQYQMSQIRREKCNMQELMRENITIRDSTLSLIEYSNRRLDHLELIVELYKKSDTPVVYEDPNNKLDMKRVSELPDDVLKHIRSYFTYDTRISLLETVENIKMNPMRQIMNMHKKNLIRFMYKIYNSEVMYEKSTARNRLMNLYYLFYGNTVVEEIHYNTYLVEYERLRMMEILNIYKEHDPKKAYMILSLILLHPNFKESLFL